MVIADLTTRHVVFIAHVVAERITSVLVNQVTIGKGTTQIVLTVLTRVDRYTLVADHVPIISDGQTLVHRPVVGLLNGTLTHVLVQVAKVTQHGLVIPSLLEHINDTLSWLAGNLFVLTVVQVPIAELELSFAPILDDSTNAEYFQEGVSIAHLDALYQSSVLSMGVIELVRLSIQYDGPEIFVVFDVTKHCVIPLQIEKASVFPSIIVYEKRMSRLNL